MKKNIFIVAIIALISLNSHDINSNGHEGVIAITLANGKERKLNEEGIRKWFQEELQTSSTPLLKIGSLPELFDFIIDAKKEGLLNDIKPSKIYILIDQLNDAIRKEEQILPYLGKDEKKIREKKIAYAKNKITELLGNLDHEK